MGSTSSARSPWSRRSRQRRARASRSTLTAASPRSRSISGSHHLQGTQFLYSDVSPASLRMRWPQHDCSRTFAVRLPHRGLPAAMGLSLALIRADAMAIDFNGKTILITGGTGSLGKQLTQYILANWQPRKLIIFSRDELKQYEMRQALS